MRRIDSDQLDSIFDIKPRRPTMPALPVSTATATFVAA
jgi:hypothetical protein